MDGEQPSITCSPPSSVHFFLSFWFPPKMSVINPKHGFGGVLGKWGDWAADKLGGTVSSSSGFELYRLRKGRERPGVLQPPSKRIRLDPSYAVPQSSSVGSRTHSARMPIRRRKRILKRRSRRVRFTKRRRGRGRFNRQRRRRTGRRLRSRSKINVGVKYERRYYPQTVRPWPPSDGPIYHASQPRTSAGPLCRSIAIRWYEPGGTAVGERIPIQVDGSIIWPNVSFLGQPSDLISSSSRYGITTNYVWRFSDLSLPTIDAPWLRFREFRVKRVRMYFSPRTTVRTTGSANSVIEGRIQGGDVAFMCTRKTRAIDDQLADINPVGMTRMPEDRLSDTSYYQLFNRPDRAKRVVIRRDWSSGGKGVVFKFRPTINKRQLLMGDLQASVIDARTKQTADNTYITKRIPYPWMPFFEFYRVPGGPVGAPTEYMYLNTTIPFYGMCVAMRPMSATNGTFPEFDVRVSFDVEYRKPITLGEGGTMAAQSLKSYKIFADTLGAGY